MLGARVRVVRTPDPVFRFGGQGNADEAMSCRWARCKCSPAAARFVRQLIERTARVHAQRQRLRLSALPSSRRGGTPDVRSLSLRMKYNDGFVAF